MSRDHLVSIIIDPYNGADFLNETIDSILRQTYQNIEVIFVDDGSTDDTLKIIQGYARKDLCVRILHHENSGLSATREAGCRISKGEYVVLAADDVWNPYIIEDLVQLFVEHADAIVIYNRQTKDFLEISSYSWDENLLSDTIGERYINYIWT